MKYELEGMSCGGCLNNVKQALLQVPEVTEVEVQLNPQSAVITMNKFINVDELQAHLQGQDIIQLKKLLIIKDDAR